ncbi:VWA domain-containing protein [Kitasatospora cineracea]|uniref:vWA domain-containing protein n=1 Tax=Kitasatospora cineracea TaxID=88074 RepID=UPI00343E75EE
MTTPTKLGFGRGYDERQPVIVLLDTSASMARPTDRPRITELNRALADWFGSVRSQGRLRARVEVCLITFGSGVRVFEPSGGALVPAPPAADAQLFAPIDRLIRPELTADGYTDLLPAIRLALELAARRHRELTAQGLPALRPLIWLLTDGAPTDGAGRALSADDLAADAELLRQAEERRECVFFTVGVRGADRAVLEVLAPKATYMLEQLDFGEILQFLFHSVDRVNPEDTAASAHQQVAHGAELQAAIAGLIAGEL